MWNWSGDKKTPNERLNNMFEVQQFLGFYNYYWRFILKLSENAEPLMWLTKQDDPVRCQSKQQLAFKSMITACTMAPILRHFEHGSEVIIESGSSDYVSLRLLSQHDDDVELQPVGNLSKTHSLAKCNYDIYDKELLVMIIALELWRPDCEGASHLLHLLMDHTNHE